MKDLIQKLNSIDVMDLFKKKSIEDAVTSTEALAIGKGDKMLMVMLGLGTLFFILGAYSSISTWTAYRHLSALKVQDAILDQAMNDKKSQIQLLKKQNMELLEKISHSPLTQSDFMKTLSDVFAKAGLAITKIVTGTASEPNLIQIESEGSFEAIQAGLAEIKKISPSTELKTVAISYNRDTGYLKLATTLKFVAPPKITILDTPTQKVAEQSEEPTNFVPYKMTSQFLQLVQFQPKNNSEKMSTTPPNSGGKDATKPSDGGPVNRNPFYMPPPTNQATNNFGNGMDGNTMQGGPGAPNSAANGGRPPGLYVTGCITMGNRAACIFQLPEGGTAVFSKGQTIQFGFDLERVSQNGITVITPNGEMNYKIGEQIK
jgi:hypothetical protein